MSKMNTSNFSLTQSAPERINLHLGSRGVNDARIEGALIEHQHLLGGPKKTHGDDKPGGPVKELTAASALTSLVKPHASNDGEEDDEDFEIPQRFTKSGRKKATPFPLKLMKVLSKPEYQDIITWLPDGKSFTIVRPKAFVADILPGHFKSAKYSSFTRKLHRWGFQRHLRGEEAGAFFHKLFQRGRLDMVEKMTCYKPDSKGASMLSGKIGSGVSFRDPMIARQGMVNNRLMNNMQHQQPMQNNFNLPSMQDQFRVGGGGGVGAPMHPSGQRDRQSAGDNSMGSVDRLNAAIELEVNRRLKERITAATISRQALALMQQQSPQMNNNDRSFGVGSGGGAGNMQLGLNLLGGGGITDGMNSQSTPQDMQLQQLQQQQQQLQQQQQQLQQQQHLLWGGQSYGGFDNNQGM